MPLVQHHQDMICAVARKISDMLREGKDSAFQTSAILNRRG